MKIKKNDLVLIIKGKDKNRKGKVIKVLPKKQKVIIEGLNLKKKHFSPRREGEKGEIVEIPAPLSVANVKLICPKCKKPTKVGYKIISDAKSGKSKKIRICKKCGGNL